MARWINADELMERVGTFKNLWVSREIGAPLELKNAEVVIKFSDLQEIVENLAAESNPPAVLLLSFMNPDNPEKTAYVCPICNRIVSSKGEKLSWEDEKRG